jgi:hypothetical protein
MRSYLRLEARVLHIALAGAVMTVRLRSDEFGLTLYVDVAAWEFAELKLSAGERVFVSPRGQGAIVSDYMI